MRTCRTCLSRYDLCPLFGEFGFSSDQLFVVTGVKISPKDGLPQIVCKSCVKAIMKSLHLREISLKAEEFFKTISNHNVIKTEDKRIIDHIQNIINPYSKENSKDCSRDELNEITDSNVINDDDQSLTDDFNFINENDTHCIGVKNYFETDMDPYDTEFVNFEAIKENEHGKDKSTKSRNCITLSNNAQIILYPTKTESNSNNIQENFHKNVCQDSDGSLKIYQQAKTTTNKIITEKPTNCIISHSNRNYCQSEIYETALKNTSWKKSDSSQTAFASGQTAIVSGQTAIVSDQSTNVFNQTANLFGHTANIFNQTANLSGQVAKVPCTVTATAEIAKCGHFSGIRFEDFISSKELYELFKDSHKFGKKTNKSGQKTSKLGQDGIESDQKGSEFGQKVASSKNVMLKLKDIISNKKLHKTLKDEAVKSAKKLFIDSGIKMHEDQTASREEQNHENLFEILMSNLKEKFAKFIPNDIKETNVIKKKCDNILPTKVDQSRRKFFQERNKKLMSLAVTPYTAGAIQCSVCSDVTASIHSFRSHAMKHFEKQHVCQFAGCDKKFVHRSQLTRHEQCLHGVEKSFACGHCAYRAVDRPTIKNHIRAQHTGERPYECNECGAKFRMRNNIIQHIKQVHNKPNKHLQCEFCPLRFQYRRDLWTHQDKSHFYTYNYCCYLCTNTYRSGCSTRKHLVKVHGVPKEQQLVIRRDKIKRPDAPTSSNIKPIVSNIPR